MKFLFNNTQNGITLPLSVMDKLKTASDVEIRVLLYAAALAQQTTSFDANDIQAVSGLDLTEIIIALQFWRGAEVIYVEGATPPAVVLPQTEKKEETVRPQKHEIPSYSGEEIARLFDENGEIKMLVDECQKIAGKMFNPLEINKIVSLYDYLGLSSEYIMLLYNYCKGKGKTVVHYVEKTAFNLYDEGVDNAEKLQEYIKYKEQLDSAAGQIRKIFGMGTRKITKQQEEFIHCWTNTWGFSFDLIEYAYEITANSTTNPTMNYTNKILMNWHNKGIKTVEEAKNESFEFKKTKQKVADKPQSFDNDEFFEAALKRSYENLGKKPN